MDLEELLYGKDRSAHIFDCARSDNEVVLLHSRIDSNEHTRRTCNNGSIIGETIQVGNCYTSRLHVTVSPDLIGEGIECISCNGTVMVVGSSTIITETMGMYSATDLIL